jgi:hypothetical protein
MHNFTGLQPVLLHAVLSGLFDEKGNVLKNSW